MISNIQHLKYAVEVEKMGSISRAAENLYMSQPHLSKAIRALEDSLDMALFNRTPAGMVPTKKGSEFLIYAKNILAQVEEMESLYKQSDSSKQVFDIAVPRASYISFAFTELVKELDPNKDIDINYSETNSIRAIKNVAESISNIAIIRYQTKYEKYFLDTLKERQIDFRPVFEFEYLVLMSKKHPLASETIIDYSMLQNYTEIIHGDIFVPTLPISEANQIEKTDKPKKKIALYERGSQFELLLRIPTTYMWVSPMPQDVLDCFSLVQKECITPKNKYKDILIFRRGYRFSEEDEMFLCKLEETVKKVSRH